mmetsp:Transcript_21030/g.44116  ORF Transcript_21030/g.44116 Transcript_21030/m.44116 type:complete len:437 (+) Transcript_21030:271-1581(+)|eukprot:CAMPEP_0201118080 /NCGR_PEP_ID=MMETSP0850-20130426/2192_1 /ASSEMBLY_ACC=CAM_ASM_000622 /TAXON_ID=183588 /ORGANISM="Pseudo-nitzschia fraudulenta, Strain WWA7" /LENGTH=436 /DNA_ID=CAMNT_0047383013 /DNA_START=249 /DNA_END=1559 /DNA_ORIENTATION=+
MIHRTNQVSANLLATTLLLLTGLFHVADAALQAGDNICIEGYVMDFFCINRGTLLDNPSVRTLENPEKHSIHCLVDVNSCVTSPFEILLDPKNGETMYRRGWQLDENSKQQAVALAQSVGSCTTCNDGNNAVNSHVLGFRAVMNATILALNEADASIPPTIQINNIQDTTAFAGSALAATGDNACLVYYGMQDIVDKAAVTTDESGDETSSSGGGSLLDSISVDVGAAGAAVNKLRTQQFAHASLMMVSWGFLLPSGTLLAKFYKHRPDGLWFKLHRAIQTVGLLLALAGWIIALMNFNVFKDYGFRNYQHGICGMVVMILGLLQPLNALIRPHAPENESEAKSTARFAWEIWHKSSGWIAVLLAIPTIVLGTLSLPVLSDQTNFQIGYGAGCIGGLLLLVAYIFYDKTNFEEESEGGEGKSKDETEQPREETATA